MSDRSPLLWTGVVLMVAAVLFPLIMWGSAGNDGWEGLIGWAIFTFIFAPFMFLVGLVLLIVGAVRGHGGQQQQQQQVVVMTASQARAAGVLQGLKCGHCGAMVGPGEQFCTACGQRVAHG